MAELEEVDATDLGGLPKTLEDFSDARLPVRRPEEALRGEADGGEHGIASPQRPLEVTETLLRVVE
jgi:hypothetical protein